jgi:hypothetical protein
MASDRSPDLDEKLAAQIPFLTRRENDFRLTATVRHCHGSAMGCLLLERFKPENLY